MFSPSLDTSLVRILLDDQDPRHPLGAGFLVTPKHILTCAHVINAVLGRDEYAADPPAAEIFLDFPLLHNHALLRAKVLPSYWFPVAEAAARHGLEDIAVLELCSEAPLSAEVRPAPLVVFDDSAFADCRVRLFGFSIPEGTYANLVLQGKNSRGMVEMHHQGSGQVMPGFSGTAAWAVKENAVCGMVVARRGDLNTAYMIPASILLRAFPEMEQHSRPANPYRGLEAFREKDAALYFGREQTIARLRQVVAEQPFAAVIGASGSGKSSVVFAGLIPALRHNGDWLFAHCRPKNQPLYELAACLIPLLYDDPILRSEKIDELRGKLHAGSVGLTGIIRQICEQNKGRYFLLIIDQFEELFTLNPDKELIHQYIDLLLECLNTEHFTVLFTMRADFFAAAVSHPALARALDSYAPIILPQLDEQGLREAVEQPANSLNVRFESGLTDLIIRDVGQEPGSLPLLEFCLTQLWERQGFREINHDAYKAIGGVQQALANHADAVYAEFTAQEREQLRHIFLRLVRPGQGTEDTRQVASLEQIRAEDRALVTRLADKRLLVTGRDEERGEETVEVVHEALIRRWQTLRQWVDEEREFLVWQEKLRVLLGQWEESEKDDGALLRGLPLDQALRWRETHEVHLADGEQEFIRASGQLREKEQQARKRRGQYFVIGLVGAVILAVLAGLFGLKARQQQVIAERKTVEVEKEKDRAEQQTLVANYNLAKAFEEKALTALKAAQDGGDTEKYKKTVLFTSAALGQKIAQQQFPLEISSIGKLFSAEVFHGALTELWSSPTMKISQVCALFSPDNRLLASAALDNKIRLWDIASGSIVKTLEAYQGLSSLSFNSDGTSIASGSKGKAQIWNIHTGKEVKRFGDYPDSFDKIYLSPDGRWLISFDSKYGFEGIWDVEAGKKTDILDKYNFIDDASFSPDGKLLSLATGDKAVRLIDTKSWDEIKSFYGHTSLVTSVSFSPDGRRLVSYGHDGTLRIWDVISEREIRLLKEHASGDFSFTPNGRKLVICADENFILNIESGNKVNILNNYKGINQVSLSPDGSLLSSLSGGNVRIFDTESWKELTVIKGHSSDIREVVFNPNTTNLLVASEYDTVRTWNIESGEEQEVLKKHSDEIRSTFFSHDGKFSASKDWSQNSIKIFNEKKVEIAALQGGDFPVAFSFDGNRLASDSSKDNIIRLWDIGSGKELSSFKGNYGRIESLLFSNDDKLLATGFTDGTVRLWEVASGKILHVFRGHSGYAEYISFSPDGERLASGSSVESIINLWDTNSGKRLATLKDQGGDINSINFNYNGTLLASGSHNGTVKLWDTIMHDNETKLLEEERGYRYQLPNSSSCFGSILRASGYENGTIEVRNINTGKSIILQGHIGNVTSVSFSLDGKKLVSGSDDKTVRVWDIETGQELTVFRGHVQPVTSASFSPDGKLAASGAGFGWGYHDGEGTIRLWNVMSGKELAVLHGHSESVWSISFSPDGKLLSSGSTDTTIRIWNIRTGKELAIFKGHTYAVYSVSFSPNGKLLASGSGFGPDSGDGSIRIWDIESKKEIKILEGHSSSVGSLSFSPDGKILASGSGVGSEDGSGSVRLWDVASGKEMTVLKEYKDNAVYYVSFSADGKKVIAGSDDNTLRMWDVRPYTLFTKELKPTPLYRTFINGVKFLWQLKLDGLEFLPEDYTPILTLYAQNGYNFLYDPKFRPLLNPPPPGQSKFDQVLEWAEKQQGR
ncbi:MAG: trypsin-like peptidase domain-containing protein [Candidatus Electrothrix scaldis]|nr:MAG: trypsin-like peptidase domain-containing protein [Candidatus Electrothrix sp. GW3-3]